MDPTSSPMNRFAFGDNWQDFSATRLDEQAFAEASKHLAELVARHPVERQSFLDVGCGSGLFMAVARKLDFRQVVGFDFDPDSVSTSRENLARFTGPAEDGHTVSVLQGDALDPAFQESLGRYSMVYAWGSLHHTGAMWRAVDLTAARVAEGGLLLLAIYNKSMTSPAWWWIKRGYVASPPWGRRTLVGILSVVAAAAKAIYTRKNPFVSRRGMNFHHNMVDWVGGFPYEYASVEEVIRHVEPLGFKLEAVTRGATPIACNEFIFRRLGETPAP